MNIAIIGGGISGISAAKVALKAGHRATIIESAEEPGGLMARIANCRVGFKTFLDEIRNDPNLTIISGARVIASRRDDNGLFTVDLDNGSSIEADKVIIATGLSPFDAKEIKGKRVLTSLEYDQVIDQRNADLPPDFDKIAFVLCVGSRCEEYPLCSSICCSYTIREIKWTLHRATPEITVFYNDLRFSGKEFAMEQGYRDKGVEFIRSNSRYFDEDETGVTVRYFADGCINERRFNYVVLAIGLRPNPELAALSRIFGFSLNEMGFVKEEGPMQTDVPGIYASGGALEPMSIKDAILTGFGAGYRSISGPEEPEETRLYREEKPGLGIDTGEGGSSWLFHLEAQDVSDKVYYEFLSEEFVKSARKLRAAGKDVCIVTRNLVTPSLSELTLEKARREGVVFVNMEEGQTVSFGEKETRITGPGIDLTLPADRIVRSADYLPLFEGKEFLIAYRSEPQLRWSPTKWGRKRFHYGFLRFPRAERWEMREFFGALGEIVIDEEGQRVLPEVNEERCSGCGSCKDSCPQSAIEITYRETPLSIFGTRSASQVPIARIKEDSCVRCGLCVSTCPSDVIIYNDHYIPEACDTAKVLHTEN